MKSSRSVKHVLKSGRQRASGKITTQDVDATSGVLGHFVFVVFSLLLFQADWNVAQHRDLSHWLHIMCCTLANVTASCRHLLPWYGLLRKDEVIHISTAGGMKSEGLLEENNDVCSYLDIGHRKGRSDQTQLLLSLASRSWDLGLRTTLSRTRDQPVRRPEAPTCGSARWDVMVTSQTVAYVFLPLRFLSAGVKTSTAANDC